MKAKTLAIIVTVPLAGCSLLIGLEDVPPVIDASSEASIDAPGDAGSDVAIDSPLDPSDCGANHEVCSSKQCVPGGCLRRVFVSSTLQMGNMGTITGADNQCGTLGFPLGEFHALISESDSGAKERIGSSNAPFVLVNGIQVAANSAALFSDAGLEHAIDMTEDGGEAGTVLLVWTGTGWDGEPDTVTSHCGEWILGAPSTGGAGVWSTKDHNWLYAQAPTCDTPAHLYCVEK